MKKIVLFVIFSKLFIQWASGQEQPGFKVLFEKNNFSLPGLIIKDAIQASDGFYYLVGAQKSSHGDLDGILVMVDTAGEAKLLMSYGGGKDDILNGITQTPSGSFILVGASASQNNGTKSAGWVLNVNDHGAKLTEDTYLENTGNRQITHLAQNDDGQILLCGQDNQPNESNLWIALLSPKGKTIPIAIGNGQYQDVKTMISLQDGNFLLMGNTNPKTQKKFSTWYAIFSPLGVEVKHENIGLRRNGEHLVSGSGNVLNGYSSVIGETFAGDGLSDLFIQQVDGKGALRKDTVLGFRDIDWAKGILSTLDDDFFLILRTNTLKGYLNQAVLLGTSGLHQFKEQRDIHIARMLLTSENQWLIFGTANAGKGQSTLWTAGFTPISSLGKSVEVHAKGLDSGSKKLSCSEAKYTDGIDGKVSPNERGFLEFTISNNTNAPQVGISVEISAEKKMEGLNIQNRVVMRPISGGKQSSAKIPVWAAQNLQSGTSTFSIKVFIANQQVCATRGNIVTTGNIAAPLNLSTKAQQRNLTVISPRPDPVSAKLEKRTDGVREVIRIREVSSTPSRGLTTTLYRNGVKLGDAKETLIKPTFWQEGTNFITEYDVIANLEPGNNEFILEITDGEETFRSSPVLVYRTTRKPTLHLLAIAPTYNNLKYNGKDARDIVASLQKQSKLGLYDSVYVHGALVNATQTTKINLEKAFEDIYAKSLNDYSGPDGIEPEDVLVVFISSHGKIARNKTFRIPPSDFNAESEMATTIDFQKIVSDYLHDIDCKMLVLIDACHSGGAKDDALTLKLLGILEALPGKLIVSSSSESELSYEDPAWENGAFTKAILEALNSNIADQNQDGFLSAEELVNFVTPRVRKLVSEINQKQTPKVIRKEIDMTLPLFKLNK